MIDSKGDTNKPGLLYWKMATAKDKEKVSQIWLRDDISGTTMRDHHVQLVAWM